MNKYQEERGCRWCLKWTCKGANFNAYCNDIWQTLRLKKCMTISMVVNLLVLECKLLFRSGPAEMRKHCQRYTKVGAFGKNIWRWRGVTPKTQTKTVRGWCWCTVSWMKWHFAKTCFWCKSACYWWLLRPCHCSRRWTCMELDMRSSPSTQFQRETAYMETPQTKTAGVADDGSGVPASMISAIFHWLANMFQLSQLGLSLAGWLIWQIMISLIVVDWRHCCCECWLNGCKKQFA